VSLEMERMDVIFLAGQGVHDESAIRGFEGVGGESG